MKILFEDEQIIAVQKPAGWLSVPSTQGRADSRSVVGIELQNQINSTLFPLHRLDFEVEGVLAFAKNSQAQKKISNLWNSGKVKKIYRALTSPQNFSHWPQNVVGRESEIGNSPWNSKLVAGKRRAFVADYGLNSTSNWKILSEDANRLEWQLEPVTGRRHQLRVELSRHGFPIWGDTLYGSAVKGPSDEIALKAVSLQIEGYELIEAEWSWQSWIQK